MSSKDKQKHLEAIKEHISKHAGLSEEEKSNAFKHIEEWYAEDKAWGSLAVELAKISPKIEAIMAELGLV